MMPGAPRDGLTPRIGRRPRGRQGKGEAPSPGRTASSPSLSPLIFVKRGRYHCGKSRFPGKREEACLQPLPVTSSHWGCGQPVRGPRPLQVDSSRHPVHLSQCPLRFRLPPLMEGDAPLQPPYWAHTGRPVTSWPNGSPRASPLHINPGGSPMLCPAVSSPLPGLAHPQLSPLSPARPAPRSRQQLGGRGAARQRITLPLESRLPVCETRLFLPSALRPPLWPPWHSQSPAQLSLVPSGSCFLLFPLFPLPRSS